MDMAGMIFVVLAAFVVAGAMVAASVTYWWRSTHVAPSEGGPHAFTCVTCGTSLSARLEKLRLLSPQERGLIVCEHPHLTGAVLAELVCASCGAAHCFVVRGRKPEYVGTDIFAPQTRTSKCLDCHQTLERPNWQVDTYIGNLSDAPLRPRIGLICSRCGGVSCVECCRKATRNRTTDGSFLCPRCFRGPVDKVYHF
jgi:hypothetical protein